MEVSALIMLFKIAGSFEKEDFVFVRKSENRIEYAIITKESYK